MSNYIVGCKKFILERLKPLCNFLVIHSKHKLYDVWEYTILSHTLDDEELSKKVSTYFKSAGGVKCSSSYIMSHSCSLYYKPSKKCKKICWMSIVCRTIFYYWYYRYHLNCLTTCDFLIRIVIYHLRIFIEKTFPRFLIFWIIQILEIHFTTFLLILRFIDTNLKKDYSNNFPFSLD